MSVSHWNDWSASTGRQPLLLHGDQEPPAVRVSLENVMGVHMITSATNAKIIMDLFIKFHAKLKLYCLNLHTVPNSVKIDYLTAINPVITKCKHP